MVDVAVFIAQVLAAAAAQQSWAPGRCRPAWMQKYLWYFLTLRLSVPFPAKDIFRRLGGHLVNSAVSLYPTQGRNEQTQAWFKFIIHRPAPW